jgi:hypothetical protein
MQLSIAPAIPRQTVEYYSKDTKPHMSFQKLCESRPKSPGTIRRKKKSETAMRKMMVMSRVEKERPRAVMHGFIPVPIKGTVLAVVVIVVGICTNSVPMIHPRVAHCNHSYHKYNFCKGWAFIHALATCVVSASKVLPWPPYCPQR